MPKPAIVHAAMHERDRELAEGADHAGDADGEEREAGGHHAARARR